MRLALFATSYQFITYTHAGGRNLIPALFLFLLKNVDLAADKPARYSPAAWMRIEVMRR